MLKTITIALILLAASCSEEGVDPEEGIVNAQSGATPMVEPLPRPSSKIQPSDERPPADPQCPTWLPEEDPNDLQLDPKLIRAIKIAIKDELDKPENMTMLYDPPGRNLDLPTVEKVDVPGESFIKLIGHIKGDLNRN